MYDDDWFEFFMMVIVFPLAITLFLVLAFAPGEPAPTYQEQMDACVARGQVIVIVDDTVNCVPRDSTK